MVVRDVTFLKSIPATPLVGCVVTYTETKGLSYGNGIGYSMGDTVAKCQAECTRNDTCVAVDFEPANSEMTRCYLHKSNNLVPDSMNKYDGVFHYLKQPCVTPTLSKTCFIFSITLSQLENDHKMFRIGGGTLS